MRRYFLEDPVHPEGGTIAWVKRDDDCVFCEHCTDVFWDYTHCIYITFCNLGIERPLNMDRCKSFKEDYYSLGCIECPDIGEYPECYDETKYKECPRKRGGRASR